MRNKCEDVKSLHCPYSFYPHMCFPDESLSCPNPCLLQPIFLQTILPQFSSLRTSDQRRRSSSSKKNGLCNRQISIHRNTQQQINRINAAAAATATTTTRITTREKMRIFIVIFLSVLLGLNSTESYTPVSRGCSERSCYPATGNLLIGRQDKLTSNSTCGEREKERYCILSYLDTSGPARRQNCFWCDSTESGTLENPRTSHRVENIVFRLSKGNYPTWWQGKNGEENVLIQLDLEAEFHVTHLIITFKTFRPKAMYIEKSYDWGSNWMITRYFAHDCEKSFPGISTGAPRYLNETVCQSRYSRQTPSTKGSVIYRVLPPTINLHSPGFNPYSKEVQDLLKTTNIRIHLKELHTLGDENLLSDERSDIREKYYFSIYDMTIRGSCSCYGHAESCLPEKSEHESIVGMVHGKCNCTHNTKGNNCEYCLDDYNDVPWRPATGEKKNECKKCECYGHATSCYFNPTLYSATGNLTGGVCENCAHNTEGTRCENCVIGYYQDPQLGLSDPNICKPCDCEPEGTIDEGLCDGKTSSEEDLTAGQCHCKEHVSGARCDLCKTGYWNFNGTNSLGCQKCSCDSFGTMESYGCNPYTGDCTCRRNVIGRDCNQCLGEHFGLATGQGCTPCDCDIGGAYDNSCDVISGQCKCRPYIGGRKCDQILDGYYTGSLDYLLYEGETAHGTTSPPTKVIIRESSSGPTSWTGFGFMKVFEGSTLTFDIPSIFTDMSYDLVLRYESSPSHPETWSNVPIELLRLDGSSGFCSNNDSYSNQFVSLTRESRGVTIAPEPLCLEEGSRYQIKLLFDRYNSNNPDPKANILIDSIVLIPRISDAKIFKGSPEALQKAEMFKTNDCSSLFLRSKDSIPEPCRSLLNSLSFYVFEGGLHKACECDSTGSESTLCDKYTGQCSCKKNVHGRKCDRCSPGTYGFSADGCQACNCHNIGSLDAFCRDSDGQCNCDEHAYGRQCNECQPGYWNFPNCQPCECNGHSDICHPTSGECLHCQESTAGFHCEYCAQGTYGNPLFSLNIRCRECPCPNTKGSGHSFADVCYLDYENNEPVCECEKGYSGIRCDVCADNYFGNPEKSGGSCKPCNCNNNWNVLDKGNCHISSGECLKCLYNTEGSHCEFCKDGYYGNGALNSCEKCICEPLGTNSKGSPCDRFSGNCSCLANVIGRHCDRCAEDHWNLASGQGCEFCDCDSVGSRHSKCNVLSGACECKEGFGGRKCDQCEKNFWGDPKVQCFPCHCNPHGSQSYQCDHASGNCVCLEGIGGEKCDECAVGFVQNTPLSTEHPVPLRSIPPDSTPSCSECGECFTNWNRILTELSNLTSERVQSAERVKVTGVTGAYTRAFEDMEVKLKEVKNILESAFVSNDELVTVQSEIDNNVRFLSKTKETLESLESQLSVTKQSIFQDKSYLESLRNDGDKVKEEARQMKEQITRLQEANVEGAYNLTREAKLRSEEALASVALALDLSDSETQRKATLKRMENSESVFLETQKDNQRRLRELLDLLTSLESKIPKLNAMICDGTSSVVEPCDALCGGAGCGSCGGLSCLNGALSKASESVATGSKSDALLIEKDREAEQVLRDVSTAQNRASSLLQRAQRAFDLSETAKNKSSAEVSRIDVLLKSIDDFMSDETKVRLSEIEEKAKECMSANMSLDAREIQKLAEEINEATNSVPDVEEILKETSEDLRIASNLQTRAELTSQNAAQQLAHAQSVSESLSEAVDDQSKADIAIQRAQQAIDAARIDLAKIENDMITAVESADKSVSDVSDLSYRQMSLQTKFIENENHIMSALKEAKDAKNQASKANSELYQLNNGFKNVSRSLGDKFSSIGKSRTKAVELQRRANDLSTSASSKLANLMDIEKEFEDNEARLLELNNELIRLNCEMMINLQVIEDKSNYYRRCSPPGSWTPSTSCQCLSGSSEPTCTSRRDVSRASSSSSSFAVM